jgi:hypothetical protein
MRNPSWSGTRFYLIAMVVFLESGGLAIAVPDFASQTGEPCMRCHIGAFGPQLTPFGRAFKIGGYTQTGGGGLAAKIPLSVMVQNSFTNTRTALPDGAQAHHYDTNNNFSLDQISVFVAGRVSENTGGFMQFTWSDVTNQVNVDNADLRPYTTLFTVGEDTDLRVGTTINNNPTVQDPYNTTPAWSFPYISSLLAPAPTATPVLAGRFAGNTIGYTAYAWYDRKLYLEGGAYTTPGAWLLTRFGDALDPGAIIGGAPYLRAAYEWQWQDQVAHVGALFLSANVNPGVPNTDGVAFGSTGQFGQDRYTDYAFDAGYQFLGDGTHIVTAQGIYIHEDQRLNASAASANSGFGTTFHLQQFNANVSYWYQNTYGVTLGWTKTWGSANPIQITSANSKPNSNAFVIEADWVPFGKADSFYAPFVNLKLGVQYTAYTEFNGGTSNYDGAGRSASDNNTLLLFAWLAF